VRLSSEFSLSYNPLAIVAEKLFLSSWGVMDVRDP